MNRSDQAVFLNATPLIALGAVYLIAAASLAPSARRDRRLGRETEFALALAFLCGGLAAVSFGVLVWLDGQPIGSQPWIALAGIVLAFGPALFFFARFRDRALMVTSGGSTRGVQAEQTLEERGTQALGRISLQLRDVRDESAAARAVLDEVRALFDVEFAGLTLVDLGRREARGLVGRDRGGDVEWFPDVRIDLDNEPSGVASAVFEAAPFAVFDAESSPAVSARLVQQVGAKSTVYVPLFVDHQVGGVMVLATTSARRAFAPDELAVMQALANEAALALERASENDRVQRGFYRIASVLSQPVSRGETHDAVAQAAAEALGGACAAVLMPHGRTVSLAGAHELPEGVEAFLRGGLDEAAMTPLDAARDGRILAARSLAEDERFGPSWEKLAAEGGRGALLAIPIETPRNTRGGLVLVLYDGSHTFTNEDLELARHLAGAARGALERSDLFESERASRALAQQLARTGALVATELDPAAVLDEVVQQGPALLAADATAIWLVEGDELVITAAVGPGSEAALGVRAPATGWLSGDVFQSRTPIALEEVDDEHARGLDPLLGAGHSAYLGVPLVGPEGSLHGVLTVYADGPRTWREEEVEALRALAANTSAALSNAELYQRVALEKEQSTAILANIADGIVAVDREGSVVLWNAAAEEITGVPATEALGRPPAQVLQRDLGAGANSPLGDRLVPILKGGEETWLSVTEAVMRDPAGAVAGRIFAFRDISGDRLVEQMKSEFVSAVSHELRAPLTSIYGFAQTLLREDVAFGSEERKTFLGYIASETERLTMIVDALLNVARLDTGDLHVDLAATDVRALVSDVVATVEQGVLDGHSFVLDLPPESEPLAAEVDPEKLRQVLIQLLDNAVKYSPGGGRVTVAARRKTDKVEFAVVDEGIGIPTGERERIFRKFYRAEGSGGRSGSGTGLGLFIVQRLVEAMGGQVRVDSTEGRGSAFTVELPAAAAVSPVGT